MAFPVVLRFASVQPRALGRIRMHARRSAGDLEHIHPAARALPVQAVNEFHEGGTPPGDDWVERFHKTAREAAESNREARAQAAEGKGDHKAARRIRRQPAAQPWAASKGGPLREGVLTASADWFAEKSERLIEFKKAGLAFLREHFGGALLHVRYDIDEAAPHFHFVVAKWHEETARGGARVRMLRPRTSPLLADYEAAQDAAGAHFAPLGLVRGQRRRDVLRLAKQAGLEPPPKKRHRTPAQWRADLRNEEAALAVAAAHVGQQAATVAADARELGRAITQATGDALDYTNAPREAQRAAVAKAKAIQRAKEEAARRKREEARQAAMAAHRPRTRERQK